MAAIGVSDGIVVNQIHEDNDFFFFLKILINGLFEISSGIIDMSLNNKRCLPHFIIFINPSLSIKYDNQLTRKINYHFGIMGLDIVLSSH